MTRKLVFAAAMIVLTIAAAPVLATVHQVNVSSFFFTPRIVTITAGDTVRWVWVGGTHTATSGDTTNCTPDGLFDGPVDSGHHTYQFALSSPGTVEYFCRFHCGMLMMHGAVVVQPNTTGVSNPIAGPERAALEARPNPLRTGGVLVFRIDQPAQVRLEIFDAAGRLVSTLADRAFGAGEHTVSWDGRAADGSRVPSGTYFAKRTIGSDVATAAVMLIR